MNENMRLKNVVQENRQEIRNLEQRYSNVMGGQYLQYRNDVESNQVLSRDNRYVNKYSNQSHNEQQNVSNRKNVTNQTNVTEQNNIRNVNKITSHNTQEN